MRGGADGVGASQPQLVPATILRKNFEFIAMIKPHEVPNRPEFYMIGSGITEAFLNALTIGATCTHEDFRAPCFTNEEIAAAKTQLNAEQVAFDALSVEEQAAHTAAGGLAPVSCACRECGKPTDTTVSLGWSFGICGIATDSCSGTSPIKGGCYSSTSSGCDCSTLKTI